VTTIAGAFTWGGVRQPQAPDALADRGAGDAHPVCRRAEIPFFRGRREQRQKIRVHIIVQLR